MGKKNFFPYNLHRVFTAINYLGNREISHWKNCHAKLKGKIFVIHWQILASENDIKFFCPMENYLAILHRVIKFLKIKKKLESQFDSNFFSIFKKNPMQN